MKTITVYVRPDGPPLWLAEGARWFVPVIYHKAPSEGFVAIQAPESALQGGWFHPANCRNIKDIARDTINATTTVTRDGIEVKTGQHWRDCDKRCPGRVLEVEHVEPGYAFCRRLINGRPDGKAIRLSICRMHKSSTGYELVS